MLEFLYSTPLNQPIDKLWQTVLLLLNSYGQTCQGACSDEDPKFNYVVNVIGSLIQKIVKKSFFLCQILTLIYESLGFNHFYQSVFLSFETHLIDVQTNHIQKKDVTWKFPLNIMPKISRLFIVWKEKCKWYNRIVIKYK